MNDNAQILNSTWRDVLGGTFSPTVVPYVDFVLHECQSLGVPQYNKQVQTSKKYTLSTVLWQ